MSLRIKSAVVSCLFFLIIVQSAAAQTQGTAGLSQGRLSLGMNLEGFVDYGSEWAWLDIMKYARPWFSQNAMWVEGGKNAWDTEFAPRIATDSEGWPLELPAKFDGAEAPQMLSTVWANTKSMRQTRWLLTYKGQGEVLIGMDGKVVDSKPGKITFDLKAKDGLLKLSIAASKKGDHVRDIRIVPESLAADFATQPLNPDWLAKVAPFKTLRFMDWGATNFSEIVSWKERSTPARYTWAEGKGVPYETMITVANQLGSDAWVCVPHKADADYIKNMATLFRDKLKPGLKLYVEYSNETWNWIFSQTHYLRDAGSQTSDWPERIVPFIQNALDIWTETWKNRKTDLIRTVGVQTGWYDVAKRVAANLRPGSVDALAGTFYFAFDEKAVAKLKNLGAKATAADVAAEAKRVMTEVEMPRLVAIQGLADELKLRLVFYEGGQHLTPDPFGSEQPYNPALEAVQTSPAMYDLYSTWLGLLRTLPQASRQGGLVAPHFVLAAAIDGRYGSWGALTDIQRGAPYKTWAPKYQALLDEVARK